MEPFNHLRTEKKTMVTDSDMKKRDAWSGYFRVLLLAAVFLVWVLAGQARAATGEQRVFPSPEEAVKSLVEALKANDLQALGSIFGPDSEELIESGDPVEDQARRSHFVKLYEEKNSLTQSGQGMELSVGNEDWPFPIPVVQKNGQWYFDTEAGRDEILARRIGKNEWYAIQFCLAYVDAQREYAGKDRDGDGLLTYARKFRSDQGKHNGLYWEAKEGEEQSPLGELAAAAQKQGYDMEGEKPAPFLGYYYRILTGQGENAQGGAYDYLVQEKLLGGFALVAYPALYQSTGVMTFLVNHEGQVYQKDLGEKTEEAAQAISLFDPDSSWQKAEEKIAQDK
jgi:hypothetical protein